MFPVELVCPDSEQDEWEARSVGHAAYGSTAAEALSNLGAQLDDLVEDAEYNRIHAPGIYGHEAGSQVPEGQPPHDLPVPQREGGEEPPSIHQVEPPKDRV